MKNFSTFVFVWALVSIAYTYFRSATALSRKEVFKILAVGALTAALSVGILTAVVIAF